MRNNRILQDFVYFNFQRRNPEASGLLFKIDYSKYEKRSSLDKQHDFWDEYIQHKGFVHSLYTSRNYESDYRYGLDHFMPWTYVAHDQIWNLSPIEEDLNSSKSNKLPPLSLVTALAREHYGLLRYHFEKHRGHELVLEYANLGESLQTLTVMPVENFIEVYKKKMTALHEMAAYLGFADWTVPSNTAP